MLKKKIKYVDYNGNEREEEFLFNLSKAELIEMELGVVGGFSQKIEQMIAAQDNQQLAAALKSIILKSYGEKSPDGKRFVKSHELSEAFTQTEAYSEFLIELIQSEEAAAAFVKGVLPELPPPNPAT